MTGSSMRMTITSFPGRKGRWMVIDDGGTLHIVARLQGMTADNIARSEEIVTRWCMDTGAIADPIDEWCAERGER